MAKTGMQVTNGTDYGLRGLLYLAKQPPERIVAAAEIAEAEKMPEYFFSKVFQHLARAGIVNSVRGSSGGFSLARPSEEITVLQAIEAIEGPINLGKCVGTLDVCDRSATCPFHQYLKEGKESLVSTLKKYTLADALRFAESAERRGNSSI